jgi:aminopeptidase
VGGGGACTAAAFLRQFTTCPSWLHLDMAGVMENAGDVSYLGKGMSGRPTRTLVQYAATLAQNR